jgi:hypothetical protein
MVKVRAEIVLGSITAVTPYKESDAYILSFNVDKSRGQPSTFSCSLKVKSGRITSSITGSGISISAGTSTGGVVSIDKIFTGIVKTATVSPCREDPGFVILNLSGTDILSKLQGRKYTRRCRSTKGVWIGIESVARPGLRSGKLTYTQRDTTIMTSGGDINRADTLVGTRSNVAEIQKSNITKAPSQENVLEITMEAVPTAVE